jgi:hypothetical protein
LQQEIAGMADRQQSLLRTTQELDTLRGEQDGRFTRGQLASVGDLARQQQMLVVETASLADRTDQARAFALALRGAAREMERAARGLARTETGPATRRWEQNALARLQQLQQALRRDDPPAGEPPEGDQPGGEGPQPPPGDAIQRLAELKLLKLMQQDINRRTIELDAKRARNETLSDEELQTLEDLAREQGQLADLALDLTVSSAEKPEDDPDNLPDLLDDGADHGRQEPELEKIP